MIIGDVTDNELGIVYNGIHSRDFGLHVQTISDPLPTLTDVTQDIQPIIGDLYQGTNVQSKTISITFRMVGAHSYQEKYTRLHEIMAWLMPIDGEEYELTLDILPRRSWYAHVSATFDFTDSLYDATFTVPFTCSDPRAYGSYRTYQIGARNLALGAGNPFTSNSVAGQVAELYPLDVDAALFSGKMSLAFDWSVTATGGQFKVRMAVVTDYGSITYRDLATVSATIISGNQTVTVDWQRIADSSAVYLSYQQVSGTMQVQIYNLKLVMASSSGFNEVINATTNEEDSSLITINEDNTVTLQDSESTAESFPVFILQPTQDLTRIAITERDGDDYLYMGSEIDSDSTDTYVNKEPLVVQDYCQTLNNWHPFSNPTSSDSSSSSDTTTYLPPFQLENGMIGKDSKMASHPESIGVGLKSDGSYDFASTYTKGTWNGAGAIHNGFPAAYNDWQISIRLQMDVLYPRAQGKIELYLLDENNARMGKIQLKDNVNNGEAVICDVQIGTHDKHSTIYHGEGTTTKGKTTKVGVKVYKKGTKAKSTVTVKKKKTVQYSTKYLPSSSQTGTFTNFFGTISLRKVGTKYTVTIMKQNTSSSHNNLWDAPITGTYEDKSGAYSNMKLSNVGIYMAKWPIAEDLASPIKTYKNDRMFLTDLKVYQIIDGGNSVVTTPTPIATAGDEIHIDTADGTVTKNGHLFNSSSNHLVKAPGSNITGLSLQGAASKTYSFYPADGWSIAHQAVFY